MDLDSHRESFLNRKDVAISAINKTSAIMTRLPRPRLHRDFAMTGMKGDFKRGEASLIKIYLPFREQGVLRGVQPLLVSKGKPSPLRERAG